MKIIDKYIIAFVALLIFLSYAGLAIYRNFQNEDNLTVLIYKEGKLEQKVDLMQTDYKKMTISGKDGSYNIIEIKNGRARIVESNCPGKQCVKTGWLSQPGQIAVCAPHKLKVVIEGKSNVDAISY